MLRTLAACLFCFAMTTGARAATLDGVTLPDHYPVAGQSLALNGIGVRTLTIFDVRVYVAGLYLAEPSHDAGQILRSPTAKVLLLQFLHAGSKAAIEKEYREGEKNNCADGGCNPADQPDFERLVASAPGVAVGDTLTYIFTAKGFEVLANNRPIGSYANPGLGERILAGFIGNKPPSPDLRSALLGVR